MRIGFAGAGAIGCHYGSRLFQAGFDVQLLARGAHLAALQARGLRHESGAVVRNVPLPASGDAAALAECAVVLLSCKITALPALLAALRLRPDALLVTLQNGVEAPDLVAQACPGHAVAAGSAFIGARLEHPGHLIHSAAGGLRLGLWRAGSGSEHLDVLLQAFAEAGVPIGQTRDPQAMLWRKLLWNCGFNAITAISRRFAREIAADARTLAVVRRAMEETVAVGGALGVAIDAADIAAHIETTLTMGPVKTSMWQDIEAGRPTEIDFLNGYIVRQADALGLAADTNRTLAALVQAIERRSAAVSI